MKINSILLSLCLLQFNSIILNSCSRVNGRVEDESECRNSYETCNLGKDGMINVHLVPHTHDDVGWLKTIDQYYYGSNDAQQKANVQYILDTVVTELIKDPNRRFIYVEIAYFWRWWNEQNDITKALVRNLVNEGRLEFIIGGWCMNDEASTYYNDIIDQQTLGLQFILKEFGSCARPKVAWQIDPFGHSREQASLFAQFGFDGLFLGRIDYQDSDYRSKTKTREMIWQSSQNLNENNQIFTVILPNTYEPPPGFCFDIYCGDEPIMDDPKLDEFNVNEKIDQFINYTLNQLEKYKTNNLIMTMGSDFQYSNALMWFKNLDKLIFYVNQRQLSGSKINIFYSTPSCYLYSLYKSKQTWPLKNDDFFPYAHREHSFWTGYFTSRTTLKYYVRKTNNFFQIIRHLSLIANQTDTNTRDVLNILERAMAVVQHHDGVSGTERQHVAYDYAKRLSFATYKCVSIIKNIFNYLIKKLSNIDTDLPIFYCPLLNISECLPIENFNFIGITIYNPLSRSIDAWIRVPVTNTDYSVYDLQNKIELISDYIQLYNETLHIPERKSNANYEILFKINLPPTGFKVLALSKTTFKFKKFKNLFKFNENFIIENQYLRLNFDSNGNLLGILNIDTDIKANLIQNYCFYNSTIGDNSKPEEQASGAYVFRPNGNANCLSVNRFILRQGKQYTEIHQIYNEWISQTIRLYDSAKYVEFEWQIGPINTDDQVGKEIITRFQSDLTTNSIFYTDSNGREILKRKRDYRPSWPNFNQSEPIAGNYYPINSRLFIRDEIKNKNMLNQRQITLVTDRTHGGSSINDGGFEVMLHRRLLFDDGLGVSEPLNELGSDNKGLIAKGNFYLIFNTTTNSASIHRDLSHRINMKPLLVFFPGGNSFEYWKNLSNFSFTNYTLPENVNLLTFMYDFNSNNLKNKALLIRLEHFYEKNEDPILSQPAYVDLNALLSPYFKVLNIEELALGANMNINEFDNRIKFETNKNNYEYDFNKNFNKNLNDFEIILYPMQIRTFRIIYETI